MNSARKARDTTFDDENNRHNIIECCNNTRQGAPCTGKQMCAYASDLGDGQSRCCLRSSTTSLLTVPFTRTAVIARSFFGASPKIWNSLPPALCRHFPPAPQNSLLSASLSNPLATILRMLQIRLFSVIYTSTNFPCLCSAFSLLSSRCSCGFHNSLSR